MHLLQFFLQQVKKLCDFSKDIDSKIKEIIYMNDHQYYVENVRSIQQSRIMIQYMHVL